MERKDVSKGKTGIALAEENGHTEIVEFLKQNGCEL